MAEVSASKTGAIEVTKEEVTCGLCSKFYSSPKLVECLHSFCQGCIQQHLVKEEAGYIFVCAKCLHVTKTGASSAASLTSDLHVPRLLEVYRCHVTSVTPCTICTLEGNVGEATHRCLSCNDHLCTACSKKHTFSSLTATHRVVSLADLRSGKYDQDIMRKQTLLCKEHDQQECDFFCKTCSGPQCAMCIITKHKDHSFVDIRDEADKKKSELLSLLKDSEESTLPQRIEVALAEADLELMKKDEDLFKKIVTDQTELIIKKIKHQSRECLQIAAEMFKEERTRRQMKIDVAMKRSEKRINIFRLCTTLTNDGGNELVEMADALKKGVDVLSNDESSQSQNKKMATYKASISFPFDEKYFEVIQVDLTERGNVEQNRPSEESTIQSDRESKHEMTDSKPDVAITKEKELKLKSNFSAEIQSDCYITGISAMALKSTEQCYILDNMNARLKEFKLSGEKTCFINLTGKCQPFDRFILVQSGYNTYIVTVVKKILYTFKTRGWNIKTLQSIKIISKDDLKVEPLVANFAQDILVGNLPENKMNVYNTSGDLLRRWKSRMQMPFEFLKYTKGDMIISSSWEGTGSVSLESEKKGLLVKITGQTRLGLPWRPADGVMDKQGHIIVSDPKRNEISVFSSEGSQLYYYDTSTDGVSQPNCLFVDKTGLIYVSYKDGKVAVYMNKRV